MLSNVVIVSVEADPVDEYLEQTARSNTITPFKRKADQIGINNSGSSKYDSAMSNQGTSSSTSSIGPSSKKTSSTLYHTQSATLPPPAKRLRRSPRHAKHNEILSGQKSATYNGVKADIKTKLTCGMYQL